MSKFRLTWNIVLALMGVGVGFWYIMCPDEVSIEEIKLLGVLTVVVSLSTIQRKEK